MEYFASIAIGYLLGSIPTGYLILKKSHKLDITENGSKSNGAGNFYRVSKSKSLSILVLLIDALKGAGAVYFTKLFAGDIFLFPMIALIAAVLAHCYNPWLKFKGGRGLATAFGGGLLLSYLSLILWVVLWLIAYIFKKNIHFANFSATLLLGALSFSSARVLNGLTTPPAAENIIFSITVALLMLIILSKHIIPIKEYFRSANKNIRDKKS